MTDHGGGHMGGIGRGHIKDIDQAAPPEDCTAVGQAFDFIQLVGNEDNGFAVPAEFMNNPDQMFNLLRG